MAMGSYAGAMPCHDDEGAPIADCVKATGGCGVAIARLEPAGGLRARPFEEDPEPIELATARVCVDGTELAVDIDGDGRHELFDSGTLLPGGSLATEILASASSPRSCEGVFAHRALGRGIAMLSAADFDSDGRVELILSHRRQGREHWALYRGVQTPARLERVADASVLYSEHSQSGASPETK